MFPLRLAALAKGAVQQSTQSTVVGSGDTVVGGDIIIPLAIDLTILTL